MSDSELILNPKTNRYIKKSSQTGKRLLKELATRIFEGTSKNQPENVISDSKQITEPTNLIPAEQPIQPIQTALLEAGVAIVEQNVSKFKGLNEVNMDALFKKLLLERLSISTPSAKKKKKIPKKKKKERFRVAQSSSDSSDSETS